MIDRYITDHKLTGLNEALEIMVLDEPGSGGANHEYAIINCSAGIDCRITFQKGPILESGINGISQESLIAIVIDRLRCFQAGPYASSENDNALLSAEACLHFLQQRTKDRIARGVEGTSQI